MSQCKHEWVVFSTAIDDGYLIVQCAKCRTIGAVEDPTKEEWANASRAPSQPYVWLDGNRVTKRRTVEDAKERT